MIIDLSTIIITAIFILAIFGPIAYLIWKGQHRTHQSVRILRNIEKEKSIKCTAYDSWNDKTIGMPCHFMEQRNEQNALWFQYSLEYE